MGKLLGGIVKLFVKFFNLFFNLAFAAIVKLNGFINTHIGKFNRCCFGRFFVWGKNSTQNENPYWKNKIKKQTIRDNRFNLFFQCPFFERLRSFIHTINIHNFFGKITFKGVIYG